MQPLRKKEVDLVDVFLEGRISGWIVGDVVGSAETLVGIKGNLGRPAVGFAPGGMLGSRIVVSRGAILQAFKGVPLRRQHEFLQMLSAEHIEDEAGQNERRNNCRDIKYAAQALPSCSLGVEKYLFIEHFRFLRYTVRIVWKLNP